MRLTLLLLITLLFAATTASAQNVGRTSPTPKHLTLTFELQDMPGIKNAGSVWEVSYKWRMADKQEFDRWSMEGEDSARQHGVGVLLSQDSFTRRDRDLRDPEKRRFSTSVRVQGDLLRRMQNAGRQPQIVWLDAMVRIHDSKLGRNVVRRVNPAWGPDFYLSGVANVRMELTRSGAFRWTRRDVPSLALEKPLGVTVSGGRSQE